MKLQELISDQNKVHFCNQLFEKIEQFGLGSFSKADMDALLYHLMDISKKDNIIKNGYDWKRYLKVTPSKLRNLQLISSVKYLNLDDTYENWFILSKAISKKKIEVDDAKKGTVRFFVDSTHVYRFVEKFAFDNGSSLDYQRNTGQVVIKYEMYLDLVKKLSEKLGLDIKSIVSGIGKDKSYKEIDKVFSSPKQILDEFKEKFKDKAFDKVATTALELVTTHVIKFVKKKISGD